MQQVPLHADAASGSVGQGRRVEAERAKGPPPVTASAASELRATTSDSGDEDWFGRERVAGRPASAEEETMLEAHVVLEHVGNASSTAVQAALGASISGTGVAVSCNTEWAGTCTL